MSIERIYITSGPYQDIISGIQMILSFSDGVVKLTGEEASGKTSLLLILAGLLQPDEGRHELFGGDDGSDLHFLGHAAAVTNRLTVRENLHFWAALCGGGPALVAPALAAVGLAALADLDADLLSAGQTRRLGLARLLCAERPLWLLDEPTSTLDSAGEQMVVTLLAAHLQRGGLVVAATHHDLPLPGPARVRTLQLGVS